jgi:carbon monoxide dehydrogenase subunit G
MAMTMNGECVLAAERTKICRMLNDAAVLRARIPGYWNLRPRLKLSRSQELDP